MPRHLVGVAEIAKMLGVSRQRVNEIVTTTPDFPKPEAELTAGRIWSRRAVERWIRRRRRGSEMHETNCPGQRWERPPSPRAVGWDPAKLRAVRQYAEAIGSAAVVVSVGGLLLEGIGQVDEPILAQSSRKSFLGFLLGMYCDELGIDVTSTTLADLAIDDAVPPSLNEREKTATIEHLLQSRSGIYHPAAYWDPPDNVPERGSIAPGESFLYNNWDFNALGTILERLAGVEVYTALNERLAKPLQMEDFDTSQTEYTYQPSSEHPAYDFPISARDMARFGVLCLRGGMWNSQQIVPASWVTRSLIPYTVDAMPGFGYGYLWWIGDPARLGGLDFYAALGGRGQAAFIVPDLDLVVVHRVHGDIGPKWIDIWPLLSLAAGTREPDEIFETCAERLALLDLTHRTRPPNITLRSTDSDGRPTHWRTDGGDGNVQIDPTGAFGLPCMVVKRTQDTGHTSITQTIPAKPLQGRRVTFTARARVEQGQAGLFLTRAADTDTGAVTSELATQPDDWTLCRTTLDVSPSTSSLGIGVVVRGRGTARIGDFAFDVT